MKTPKTDSLGPFLTNSFGDRYLYPVNREVFRNIGAHTRHRNFFGNALYKPATLNVLVGTDSGLLLRFLTAGELPEGSRYVFLELPEVIECLEAEGVLDNLSARIACIPFDRLETISESFQFKNYLYAGDINIWKSFAALDAFIPEYADLYLATRNYIEAFAWKIRVELGNKDFIERQMENLADNRISARHLKGLFPGKTAVLLAGGPSLDAVLPWVQEHRDKLVVLAISRIARRLKDVGLAPDIFFSVDPQIASFDISKDMLDFWDKSLFVNMYHVAPPLLSQWQGRSLFIGPRYPWDNAQDTAFLDAPGPTVSNTALGAAMQMGFAQIVLAGVDLCFSPEGMSHAKGSYESQAGPQYAHFDTRVETNCGGLSFTYRAMAEAIPYLGAQAEYAATFNCRFVNPSANAAKIPHVDYRPLEEITFDQIEEPALETIFRHLPQDSEEARLTFYRETLSGLIQAEKSFRTIRRLAVDGLECNDGLFGKNGKQADFRYKKRMDKVENRLNAAPLAPYATICKKFGLPLFVKMARPDTDQDWSDAQIEEAGRIYYEAFRDSADQLLALIKDAHQRTELRLEEEAPQSDIDRLLDGWKTFAEPGRVRIWLRNRPEALSAYDAATRDRVARFEAAFEESLRSRDLVHLKGLKEKSDPAMARHKLRMLFKNQELTPLKRMLDGLEYIVDSETASLRHLGAGYVAELEKDFATALNAYQSVLETGDARITEDALQRIASVSLGLQDLENALLALHCLCGQSPCYLSQYGDLAKLLGQTRMALDAYADYLEYFPDDQVVLFKVGKTYEEQEEWEFAATVFRHILASDPGNQTARDRLECATKNL